MGQRPCPRRWTGPGPGRGARGRCAAGCPARYWAAGARRCRNRRRPRPAGEQPTDRGRGVHRFGDRTQRDPRPLQRAQDVGQLGHAAGEPAEVVYEQHVVASGAGLGQRPPQCEPRRLPVGSHVDVPPALLPARLGGDPFAQDVLLPDDRVVVSAVDVGGYPDRGGDGLGVARPAWAGGLGHEDSFVIRGNRADGPVPDRGSGSVPATVATRRRSSRRECRRPARVVRRSSARCPARSVPGAGPGPVGASLPPARTPVARLPGRERGRHGSATRVAAPPLAR